MDWSACRMAWGVMMRERPSEKISGVYAKEYCEGSKETEPILMESGVGADCLGSVVCRLYAAGQMEKAGYGCILLFTLFRK